MTPLVRIALMDYLVQPLPQMETEARDLPRVPVDEAKLEVAPSLDPVWVFSLFVLYLSLG